MKAERTDLPENDANVLFQPDLSGVSSIIQSSTAAGGDSAGGLTIKYDTNVDQNMIGAATKV